jgi:two-component system sensor histidine kinase BaeS
MAAFFLFMAVLLAIAAVLVGTAAGLIAAPPIVRVLALAALALAPLMIIRTGRRFRRLAVNVSNLVEAAGRIEAGDFSARVPERGPRDVRSLARAFNAMSARLDSTDHNRRVFVADLTHELRTPLSVIRGQAEGIRDGVYPPDPAHVEPIIEAARSLETLVETLGTLTLADVGSLALRREAVEVGVLVNGSLAAFRSAADAAGVSLQAEVAPDVPPVDADPARIRGVIGNLLANAIRATPRGGMVTVAAARGGAGVTVSVRDTGAGIPDELRERVFDRFVKGPGSPGSGLGLAIARDVVRAHGGTIELSSELGKGTEVRFSLPAAG